MLTKSNIKNFLRNKINDKDFLSSKWFQDNKH